MTFVDEKKLLSKEEHAAYLHHLKLHGYEPHQFRVEVTEDQEPMDMNDIDYVIILNIKATYLENNISNTYISKLGSQTWISEFEDDLLNKYYFKDK